MKYQVIKKFKDKYSGEIYEVGSILEITKKRAKEILSVNKLIEEYEEPDNQNSEDENKGKTEE